mgnify:CR=1 FL=1
MIDQKRGMSAWIWILIVLTIIIIGVIIYLLINGDSIIPAGIGGSSIPQPPAFPE